MWSFVEIVCVSCCLLIIGGVVRASSFPEAEIEALYDLYRSTNGSEWQWAVPYDAVNGIPWNFTDMWNQNPCASEFHWQGLNCSDTCSTGLCHVQFIALSGYGLAGTLPPSIGNFSELLQLDLDSNQLTSSLPSTLTRLTSLQVIIFSYNSLTGKIPKDIGKLTNLTGLFIDDNFFSGNVPESIGELVKLQALFMYDAFFTGTIPSSIGNLRELDTICLRSNLLHGEIPESFGNLTKVHRLDIYINELSGQVPSTLTQLTEIQVINFMNNQLSGPVGQSVINALKTLEYVSLNDNKFTGFLPSDLCSLYSLGQLSAYNNIFSGSLPSITSDCDASNSFGQLNNLQLSNNSLTGTLPSGLLKENMEILYLDQNGFSGSFPDDWFAQASNLSIVVMAINCITGTIPPSICTSDFLTQVTFDGLHSADQCEHAIFPHFRNSGLLLSGAVAGTIPECLLSKPNLQILHLSGNALSGSVPDILSPNLQNLVLSNNFLEGTLPSQFWYGNVSYFDVSFNRIRDTIPEETLAQKEVNATVKMQVNRLSGIVSASFLNIRSLNILQGNLFGCDPKRNDLPHSDPQHNNYSCGSDSTDAALIAFGVVGVLITLSIILFVRLSPRGRDMWNFIKHCRSSYSDIIHRRISVGAGSATTRVEEMHRLVIYCVVTATILATFMLIPMYSILSLYFATTVYSYAWTVAATYLGGLTPAIALLIAFTIVLIAVTWSLPAIVPFTTASAMRFLITKKTEIGPALRRFVFVVINAILTITVNAAFVTASVQGIYTPRVMMVLSLLLSLFKLIWTRALVALAAYDSRLPSYLQLHLGTQYLIGLSLFNNVIVPFLAEILVCPNCFLYAVTLPPQVDISYPLVSCRTSTDCEPTPTGEIPCSTILVCASAIASQLVSSASSTTYSYTPPFHYSFLCTSSLISTFAPVFVYRSIVSFLTKSVIPPILLWLQSQTQSDRLSKFIAFLIPQRYQGSKASSVLAAEGTGSNLSFVVGLATNFAVIMTFGVLFPPLLVIVAFTMFVDIWSFRALVGQSIAFAEANKGNELAAHLLLGFVHEDCLKIMIISLWCSVFLGGILWSWLLFDTLGDQVGPKQASWIFVVMAMLPVLLFGLKYLYEKRMLLQIDDDESVAAIQLQRTESAMGATAVASAVLAKESNNDCEDTESAMVVEQVSSTEETQSDTVNPMMNS